MIQQIVQFILGLFSSGKGQVEMTVQNLIKDRLVAAEQEFVDGQDEILAQAERAELDLLQRIAGKVLDGSIVK